MASEKKTPPPAEKTKPAAAKKQAAKAGEKPAREGQHNASTIGSLVAIWQVLAQHSSRDKPMTAADIKRKLEETHLSGGVKAPSAMTLQRRLPEMMETLSKVFPGMELHMENEGLRDAYFTKGQLRVVVDDETGRNVAGGDILAVVEAPPAGQLPAYNTIDNLLQNLSAFADSVGWDDQARQMPVRIRCVMASTRAGGKTVYLPYQSVQETWSRGDGEEPQKNNRPRRYYLESVLTPYQWRMLTDMIKVYPYISAEQTTQMLRAIAKLNPDADSGGALYPYKHENKALFENLRTLNLVIAQKQKVTIHYGEYVLEGDRPVLRQRPSDHAGLLTMFEPYALLWSNGYYYLVGFNPNQYGMMNLRVDRILKVTPVPKETFEPPEDFDPVAYRDESPVMYPGEPETVRMRCPAKMISEVMDFFGTKAKFRQVDAETVEAVLHVAPKGTALFFMQYADRVEVLEPASLRDEVKRRLAEALDKYK